MGLRFLALACLVGAAFAGPVQRQSENACAKDCHSTQHPNFSREPGKAYVYKYQSQNNITSLGNQKQNANLEATVEFHVLTKCEGMLKMRNIRIEQKMSQDEKDDLKRKLELPLSYSYSDGKFHHVCPNSKESTLSLNIKKAILSSFVNEMSNLQENQEVEENDGWGKCLTEYTTQRENGKILIRKVKDLKTCTNRHTLVTSFTKLNVPTHALFVKEHWGCNYYISDGLIQSVECLEQEKLKTPWKDRNSMIEFSGSIKAVYTGTKPAERHSWQEPVNPEEISYSIDEPREGDRNRKEVERILRSLCSQNTFVINISVGKDYMDLASLVRGMPYEELYEIYESLKDGTLCSSKKVRDIFADTLPIVATDPAIKLMVKILENNDATGLKSIIWPASLALKQHPTADTIAAIVPLVKRDQSTSTLIGVATLVNRLCSSTNCDNISPVGEVISVFNDYLGSKCSSDDEKQILKALKVFGNMGYHGKAYDNIVACAKDSSKPIRIRLAAIDAFRRLDTRRPKEFLQMYSNKNENNEIRIACFASVFKHADERQLKQLKNIVEVESNEQVSGYVYTFIQNMNKTRSPKHEHINGLLQSIKMHPPKVNYLTNSKNIEFSVFNRPLNVGGSIEADVVHGEKTKIPHSLRTSWDVYMFGQRVNLMQFGARFEDLEGVIQNLIALKQKIPKFEEIRDRLAQKPSLEELKREFNYLSLENIFAGTRPEASIYFRTLETEVFGLSTSDLSGIKELLKIAELMTKMAQGKEADFSHSFVFMNSKLVIPSVTGRSYSIDLAGSSTVGLTAKSKADFLKLPRNADVHLHLQPSVNLEVSTTVGIQSSTHRPDIKVVSRLHLESDVEARFEVRDGHVAIASLTLPSENIALAKMSTDIFEIDEDHNEKSIFKTRQKKIDYCFNHLNKYLGIAACTTVEVPKPFVLKTFPYVLPFGNGEIALKKSDDSFKSYELRFEIPKKTGSRMNYRASFDTPGSKISRRFAADLEVKYQKGQSDVLLKLVSPIKTAGGSGSFTKNDQLVKGAVKLFTSEKEIASANVTCKMTPSRSRKIYEISGEYSILNQDPTRVDGTITDIKGRKRHVSFDIRTNKPQSKPIQLKGTLMKEGRMELSQNSEWKLSSEISLQSPVGDVKLRKTIEKRSKQSEAISLNLGIDYQLKGRQKHSLAISGTSQKSSNKINTQAKLESTQDPRVNMYLTWDMQRESPESLKNDIKLKYGQYPERTYIQVKQKSRIPKTGPGHCSTTIQIPHRNIHCELSLAHHIDLSEQPRINIEADLRYKQNKHIKSVIDVKYESKSPLKASGKLELEYPGGHYIYEDEVTENDGVIEGKSKLQYKKGKEIQLHYKLRKLSNDDKFHHELECSIQTPSSRSPISGKASVELNSESLAIVSQIGPDYSVRAHLKEIGVSHISLKLPMIEGDIKSISEDKKKTAEVDLKIKTRRPRHIFGLLTAELGDKKKFEIRIQPDVDRFPKKKILVSTVVEQTSRDSKETYTSASRLQILDLIDVSLAETGEVSLLGDQECTLEVSLKNQPPVTLKFKRKTGEDHGKTILAISQRNIERFKVELDAKLKQTDNKKEFSIETSLISADHSFEDMHMYVNSQVTRSGLSKIVQTTASFKKNDKLYKSEWNSNIQPNSLEVKAQMQTPHVNFEKTAVGLSLQVSDTGVSSLINIVGLDNKKIFIQTDVKTKKHGLSLTGKLNTPFEISKDVQLQVTLDNHDSKKSLEAYIDTNNARVCDIQGRMRKSSGETQLEGSIKVSNLPKLKFQGLDVKLQSSRSSVSVSGSIQLMNNKEISLISDIKKEGDVISTTTSIATPYRKLKNAKAHLSIENQALKRSILCYLDANGERKGDVELSIASSSQAIEVKSRLKTVHTPEISAHVKCEKTGQSFSVSANVMKGTSPLLSTSLNRLSYHGGEKLLMKTKSFEDTLLDIEISKDVTSKSSSKYSLSVKGPFPAVSVTFSKNYNDQNSVSTELRACGEVQHSPVCYSLKSHHKKLVNSGNYRFYQKVTMDLEKSVGGSYSKAVGRLHVLMSAAENDYRTKVTMEVNEKKLGYELKLHSRQHENDRCSFDSYIYLPQQTSRVRSSILHNRHHMNFEADVIPNTDDPTHKLSFEMKKELNPGSKEVSGYIKMSHPRMSQPLLLTCKFEPVGHHLVKGKLVLHSGPVWGKTLMMEVIPDTEREAYGIRSIEYKLYSDDRSIDAYFKLIKQSSRSEKKIGYEWSYSTHDIEKKGGLILTLSDKTMKISYFSPSADYEVLGSVAKGPEDISLSITSAGKKMKEIRITTSDSCANIEVLKSGPLIKGQICVNKQEGNVLHLLKVDVQYRQHKCIEIRLGVDPETPEYVDVVFKCSKEESCRALKELFNPELLVRRISVLKQDVLRKMKQVEQDVADHVVKVKTYLRNLKDDFSLKVKSKLDKHVRVLKEYIRKFEEVKENTLNRIQSLIPDQVKETCKKYYQDYHRKALRCYRRLSEMMSRYWPRICEEAGRYCNNLKSALRRFDINEIKKSVVRKVNEVKQSLTSRLPKLEQIHPSDILTFIENAINKLHHEIMAKLGKFLGHALLHRIQQYVTRTESLVRQALINIFDVAIKKFHDILFKDEDFHTAKDLVLNAKEEIVKAWRNKETIAESSAKRVESKIKQDLKKMLDKQVQVLKYDPEEGEFRFKIRQPLSKSRIESVKKELNLLLRKVREHLRR